MRSRGWTSDVLRCVRKLGKSEFSLQEMYDFEEELRELHPKNRHIRPKIRQQLQVLRDQGVVRFIERGRYGMRLMD
ncbi:MAG: Dam-replacing domain protein [Candidatus Thorarchaeota archaeon]